MCVACIYAHVCRSVPMQAQVEARSWHWDAFLNCSSTLFFPSVSLTKPRTFLSLLPSAGLVDTCLLLSVLCGF